MILQSRGTRETIESIVLAVILAFIFRGFEAEAFVIPTGSMAPTLMGRHIDVTCEQCDFRYSTGASLENSDRNGGLVAQTICPICRFPQTLAREELGDDSDPNEESFNGDRLVVDKVTYLLSDPQRWDVIVFKYPYNPKQNYIKRLVGLPNETVRIQNGDVFAKPKGKSKFEIVRKPPHKLRALLYPVHDTQHLAKGLVEAGWPSRWQQWSEEPSARSWKIEREGTEETFSIDDKSKDVAWLRYRHLIPNLEIWENRQPLRISRADILDPREIQSTDEVFTRIEVNSGFRGWDLSEDANNFRGQLITDFYPYNQSREVYRGARVEYGRPAENELVEIVETSKARREFGYHWTGDLAVECDVEIESDSGDMLLDLVEGGRHFTCTIDVSTGKATLAISDEEMNFVDAGGNSITSVTADTDVDGAGSYRLCFANVDDELTLWVDDRPVKFDAPPRFNSPPDVSPKWSPEDAGDAEPVGIGSRGVAMSVKRIQVLRDLYYLAIKSDGEALAPIESTDYAELFATGEEYARFLEEHDSEDFFAALQEIIQTPSKWNETVVFRNRRKVEFPLGEGQYLPIGDNSPSSKDSRLWGSNHYVKEDQLIGKAQFVFWPHSWRRPIPYWPNFNRFRFVR